MGLITFQCQRKVVPYKHEKAEWLKVYITLSKDNSTFHLLDLTDRLNLNQDVKSKDYCYKQFSQ